MGRLYKTGEVAELIGISAITLRKWVSEKRIPFYKIGKAVRFSIPEIEEWLKTEYSGKKDKSKLQLVEPEMGDTESQLQKGDPSSLDDQKYLLPEVYEAANWVEKQINENSYCDCGFSMTIHDGEIRRTDYTLTLKHRSI